MRMTNPFQYRVWTLLSLSVMLAACGGNIRPDPAPAVAEPLVPVEAPEIRIGIALGGGAAKGFAHVGVIKMLEANGLEPVVVSGTSAGSVVGALYASGMDPFQMQRQAFALDESKIRDVSLFSGGVIKGQKLQDYVNELVDGRSLDKMIKPFAVVSTRLETGERTVFVRGNTGQAVRASSSIPGVFEPTPIGDYHYVDGGIVSPVPVDAARELGADFVIAVDISNVASGKTPGSLLGNLNQSITIMGRKLGAQELARADIVIRPKVDDIGPASFEQRNNAILEGEQAALAALPQIRVALEKIQQNRIDETTAKVRATAAAKAKAATEAAERCAQEQSRMGSLLRREPVCADSNAP